MIKTSLYSVYMHIKHISFFDTLAKFPSKKQKIPPPFFTGGGCGWFMLTTAMVPMCCCLSLGFCCGRGNISYQFIKFTGSVMSLLSSVQLPVFHSSDLHTEASIFSTLKQRYSFIIIIPEGSSPLLCSRADLFGA